MTITDKEYGKLLKAAKTLMEELHSRFDYVEPTPEEEAALCQMEAAIASADSISQSEGV